MSSDPRWRLVPLVLALVAMAMAGGGCESPPTRRLVTARWAGGMGEVRALLPTEDGGVLAGGTRGLWILRPPGTRGEEPLCLLRGREVNALAPCADGTGVWVGGRGGLHRLHEGRLEAVPGPWGETGLPILALSARGEELVVGTHRGAWARRAGRWERLRDSHSVTVRPVVAALHARSGLVLGRDGGLVLRDEAGSFHLLRRESYEADRGIVLPSNRIRALAADEEGIWVGTDRGLARFVRGRLVAVPGLPAPVSLGSVRALACSANALWVGLGGAEPSLWQRFGSVWMRRRDARGLDFAADALAAAVDGMVMAHRDGILRQRDETMIHWPAGKGADGDTPRSVTGGAGGALRVLDPGALILWEARGGVPVPAEVLEIPEAVAMAGKGAELVLLGPGGEIHRRAERGWRMLRGPVNTRSRALALTLVAGRPWIAWSDGRLEVVDGAGSRRFGVEGDLPVLDLAADGAGGLWVLRGEGPGALERRGGDGRILERHGEAVRAMAAVADGLWVLGDDRLRFRRRGGGVSRELALPSSLRGRVSLLAARDGESVLVAGPERWPHLWAGGRWTRLDDGVPGLPPEPHSLVWGEGGFWFVTLRAGLAWIATGVTG